jgi:hypothetical protein
MFWKAMKAIFAIVFAVPTAKTHSIGLAAGNGGWGDEDADHLKK